MENKSILSTFSPRTDLALAEIMKKNNLNGSVVKFLLEKLTMFFSRSEITEKELTSSLQKEINVSQKIAEQMALDIKNKLVPTLWNNLSPEEKETLLHKKPEGAPEVDMDEKEKLPPSFTDFHANNPPPRKSIPIIEQKPVAKRTGPDNYREPIE